MSQGPGEREKVKEMESESERCNLKTGVNGVSRGQREREREIQ